MTSTLERLRKLPDIFTATDALLVTNIPAAQFDHYMWRWKNAGLVRPLGNRSDVWFNLIKNNNVDQQRWETALRRALPGSVAAGHGVLMRHGITTQMANTVYLLQPAYMPSSSIEGAELHSRPRIWMRRLREAGAIDTTGTIPELDPGAALVDLMRYDPQAIDEDDIEWEDLTPESLLLFDELSLQAGLDISRPGVASGHRY